MFVGDQVRLLPVEREHVPRIIAWMLQEDVIGTAFFGDPRPQSLEEMESWLSRSHSANDARFFIILNNETHEPIGEVALRPIDWKNRYAFVSIFIGERKYRSQGRGLEALRLLVAYAFEGLNLHRIEALVLADNTIANRLFKKAGFTHEGVRRSVIWKKGKWVDLDVWGLLAQEWYPQHES